MWGGIWGSNPRHPEPQSGALPTELIPPYGIYKIQKDIYNFGTPREIRTPDLLLRRQLLYPAELLAHISLTQLLMLERVMGIEPTYPAWKAGVLPLNYTRMAVPFSLKIITHTWHKCQQLWVIFLKKLLIFFLPPIGPPNGGQFSAIWVSTGG